MVAQAAPKEKRSKKAGPLVVRFVDNKNEASKKVTTDTELLQVKDSAGATKNYALSQLSLPVLKQLAADSLKRKFLTTAFVGVKNDKNANIVSLIDTMFENIISGKLYTRTEGGAKPGRKFDFDLWAEAMLRTSQMKSETNPKVKPFSKKIIDDFRAKLQSMPDSERKVFTAKLQNDAVFKRALLEVRAKRVKTENSEFDALSAV